MRHITRLGLSAVTGLAAALCCAPLAAAADATGPVPDQDKEQVVNLTARVTDPNNVDLPPAGTSPGDELVVSGDLIRSTTTVGRFNEVCTITHHIVATDTSDLECQVTLSLPQGHLTVQGVFTITSTGPGDITLAITGGTGSYRKAHGYVHSVNTSETESQLTIHLVD